MPSVSGKQHRLMAMVANDPKAAKRTGIPQRVGREYMAADKGKKFADGGDVDDMPRRKFRDIEDRYDVSKLNKRGEDKKDDGAPSRTQARVMGGADKDFAGAFGRVSHKFPLDDRSNIEFGTTDVMVGKPAGGRSQVKGGLGVQYTQRFSNGGAAKRTTKKEAEMKHGSAAYMAKEKKHVEAMKKAGVPKKIVKEEAVEAGMKMARGGKTKMMASGGFTRAADGVAQKGKTKAKQVKMNKGGYCA